MTCSDVISMISTILTLFAFLFSIWLYCNDDFEKKFNFLAQEIVNKQEKIHNKYFFNQLENVCKENVVDFDKFQFSESNNFKSLVKLIYGILELIDDKCIKEDKYINMLKYILNNKSYWIICIYLMQTRKSIDIDNAKLKSICKKHNFVNEADLFYNEYGIDDYQEITPDELETKFDERIFSLNDKFVLVLNKLKEEL
ncbi:hypothetical protein Q7469_04880 [Glaesserella parasuis]|uniref:Uncharacterized protein n=1 Tax=Glaesserella parasuis TaxID=738 RepID=A0A6M8T333_GLAPU|nr:hypothetical protein [Glaesserella parasuis]MDD2168960.1 hypothetical protein [Glaesserella parasuis]MDG6345333.1 hypothetical protein [Glaesserella parasuis]MDG6771036.1 hypothetical protein [Glaesserella parasuis]MDO9873254.1 hypothetical protein [Glaesserella parasuis]MDO9913080.1 hypothetical protein [Glaesserella parasuis]